MIPVLFEDEYLAIVDKPAGLLVHRNAFERDSETLVDLLARQLGRRVHTVHRIDRATSGLLLFAFRSDTARLLTDQFRRHEVRKHYLALVRGFITEPGEVDSPIRNELNGPEVPALTRYRPLERVEYPVAVGPHPTARFTLVELELLTGRTHQARKHMHRINHPIVGDKRHGDQHQNRLFMNRFSSQWLFLLAWRLQFLHPATGIPIRARALVPETWWEICSRIGFNRSEAFSGRAEIHLG